MNPEQTQAVQVLRAWIDEAQSITVLTGAGISTDSGIPDFRGPQGLWTKNPKAEKMATLSHYMSDPEVRERAWQSRIQMVGTERQPNSGHYALVELERRGKLKTLITQNVDGLHRAAGSSPSILVEIHGTVREVTCMSCGERRPMQYALDRVREGEKDPPCSNCGGILKSATISFGQGLVQEDLLRSEEAAKSCDLILAIGTTLGVYPIAAVVPIAKNSGARVVIVNGEATEMDELADALIRGSIGEVLPSICSA